MVDTSVLVHLTRVSPYSSGYQALLGDRRIVISFQVRAELGGYPESKGWGTRRQESLALLIEQCVIVPHSEASNTWYARVNEKRRELRNHAGDGDVWIIAQALEHAVPLLCHDGDAVDLARAMGVDVMTLLPDRQQSLPQPTNDAFSEEV